MITKIVTLLESSLRLNRATENLLIDSVASYSPRVAPLVPAFMTYQNMTTQLDFPIWAGKAGALCVETLGLSSIQTAVSFWQWNDSKSKSDRQAPVFLAVLTGGFYLTTVLVINAMLDVSPGVYRLAKDLLPSLNVRAGVILALRAGHVRRMSEAEQALQERKAERAAMRAIKVARTQPAKGQKAPFLQPVMSKNGNGTRKDGLTR
jgi:hypothetical protein